MTSIGLIELNSIAAGIDVTDTMIKTSKVDLVISRSICSGKYMVIVSGQVAAVRSSIEAGLKKWQSAVIDHTFLSNIDDSVLPAISGTNQPPQVLKALGIIESFSVASLLEAADTAVKAANVQLIEIRLAMALGGKAFVTLTGDVGSTNSAVDAGSAVVAEKGMLVNKVVIPSPSPLLCKEYI